MRTAGRSLCLVMALAAVVHADATVPPGAALAPAAKVAPPAVDGGAPPPGTPWTSQCAARLERARLALASLESRFAKGTTGRDDTPQAVTAIALGEGALVEARVHEGAPRFPSRYWGWIDVWQQDGLPGMHYHLAMHAGSREASILVYQLGGKTDQRILDLFQPALVDCLYDDETARGQATLSAFAGRYRTSVKVGEDECRRRVPPLPPHIVVEGEPPTLRGAGPGAPALHTAVRMGMLSALRSEAPAPRHKPTLLLEHWLLRRRGADLVGNVYTKWEFPRDEWNCEVSYEVTAVREKDATDAAPHP